MNVAIATWAAPSASAVMTARSGAAADDGAGTGTLASASTAVTANAVPATPVVTTDAPIPQAATPAQDGGKDDPLVNRYPRIGVSFNSEASRLIILFRDPATGKAIDQIPSEAALKQYMEAQQKEKAAASPRYDAVVGGAAGGNAAGRSGTAGDATATDGTVGGTGTSGRSGDGTSRTGHSSTHTASLRLAAVNGGMSAGSTSAAGPAIRLQAPAPSTAVTGGASTGINLTI